MDETLTQDLKKQFSALPANVQKAISATDLPAKLQEITKKNKLLIDQAGKLETETMLVLFGIEPLENYTGNLVKNVGLSNIQAPIIAHDVNELIFKDIRENLKKINDDMLSEEKKSAENINNPAMETVVAGIEQPQNIKNNEESISISSVKSNGANPETHETIDKGIEIKINNLPSIAKETMLPTVSSLTLKPNDPYHENISPVQNIVETKLTSIVAIPKETIVIEEKTKLPEKSKSASDPYREPVI